MEHNEQTFTEIITDRIIKSLKTHIFSEKSLPKEISIITLYDDCRQELKINFDDLRKKIKPRQ